MNLGIQIESTSSGNNSVQAATTVTTPVAVGPVTPGNSGELFGQLMAQAMQLQSSPGTVTGQAETAEASLQHTEHGLALDAVVATEELEVKKDEDDLAVALPDWLQPGWGIPGVQQIHVGPHTQAITAATTLPDASSITAFARQQGLDAEAIAWLMRPEAARATPTAAVVDGTSVHAGGPNASAGPSTAVPSDTGKTMGLPNVPTTAGPLWPGGFGPSPSDANGMAAAAAAAAAGVAQAVTVTSKIARGADLLQANALSSPNPATASSTAPPVTAPDGDAAASLVLAQLRWGQVSTPAPAGPGRFAQTMGWGQNGPAPAEVSTLDLTALLVAGDRQGVPTGENQAGSGLGNEPGSDPGMADVAGLHRSNTGPSQGRTESPSHMAGSGSVTRDQLEHMSEQMADAIGERLLREIERGHWSLRLMLKPAHLGHIEIEMRLRSGELDATFAAPQAATRELLQDGLSRLKDSLSQTGMDVANLHVKDGQNRQNGGDSTPGQRNFAKNAKDSNPVSAPVQSAESPRVHAAPTAGM